MTMHSLRRGYVLSLHIGFLPQRQSKSRNEKGLTVGFDSKIQAIEETINLENVKKAKLGFFDKLLIAQYYVFVLLKG